MAAPAEATAIGHQRNPEMPSPPAEDGGGETPAGKITIGETLLPDEYGEDESPHCTVAPSVANYKKQTVE